MMLTIAGYLAHALVQIEREKGRPFELQGRALEPNRAHSIHFGISTSKTNLIWDAVRFAHSMHVMHFPIHEFMILTFGSSSQYTAQNGREYMSCWPVRNDDGIIGTTADSV